MKSHTEKNEQLVNELLSGQVGKKYLGKQVVVIGGNAHILPESDEDSKKLVDELEKKYPKQIPHLLFVPRPETYIL